MALTEKGLQTVQKWIVDFGAREAAKKLLDNVLIRKCGLSSSDLADTALLMNGLDEMGDLLENGDYEGAVIIARETADEMLEDEGYGEMDESKRKKQIIRENNKNKQKEKMKVSQKQITLKELKSLVKKILKEQITSTEYINIGDQFTYKLSASNYPQGLSPIKVEVVQITNQLYFRGRVIMIPEDTAKYLNGSIKTGTILQCHVENIDRA